MCFSMSISICTVYVYVCRGDYKVAEMIGQKSLIAIMSLNLVGYPYIALER